MLSRRTHSYLRMLLHGRLAPCPKKVKSQSRTSPTNRPGILQRRSSPDLVKNGPSDKLEDVAAGTGVSSAAAAEPAISDVALYGAPGSAEAGSGGGSCVRGRRAGGVSAATAAAAAGQVKKSIVPAIVPAIVPWNFWFSLSLSLSLSLSRIPKSRKRGGSADGKGEEPFTDLPRQTGQEYYKDVVVRS